jgi:hypothetical protein
MLKSLRDFIVLWFEGIDTEKNEKQQDHTSQNNKKTLLKSCCHRVEAFEFSLRNSNGFLFCFFLEWSLVNVTLPLRTFRTVG